MATCSNCGNELREGAVFCTACGKPVKNQEKLRGYDIIADYMQWNMLPGQIAVRIDQDDFEGTIKGINIPPGVKSLITIDGKILGELGPGRYDFDVLSDSSAISRFQRFIAEVFKGHGDTASNFISIILIREAGFPLSVYIEGLPAADVSVSAALSFSCQINDILAFHKALLVEQKDVTSSFVSSLLKTDITSKLRRYTKDKSYRELLDEDAVIEETRPIFEACFTASYPYLSLNNVSSFVFSNEPLDEVRKLDEELHVSEAGLAQIRRRNDFMLRLNREDMEQQLRHASSEADFSALMEKVDERKLLTDEERQAFALLLASQRRLREARTKEDEEVALSGIRQSKLLRDSEYDSLVRSLQQKDKMQEISDAQLAARAMFDGESELESLQVRREEDIKAIRHKNAIERKKLEDEYYLNLRRETLRLDREETSSQIDALRQAQEIRLARESAYHNMELEKQKLAIEAEQEKLRLNLSSEEEKLKVYSGMNAEQIMAANPCITPAAAEALARKFSSEQAEEKVRLVQEKSEEMRSFMEKQMDLMRTMVIAEGHKRESEVERVRSDARSEQDRYTQVMETTVRSITGAGRVSTCPSCGASNPVEATFCQTCGKRM